VSDAVEIDGATGEGGGQVLRTSLALAALTGRRLVVSNIRAGRPKPGLAAQHLAAVKAAAALCDAELSGAAVGSQVLEFQPRRAIAPDNYRFDIGTAGATTLVGQTVAVPLALAGERSKLVLGGGTHVPFAPTADYLAEVYAPALAEIGLELAVECRAGGFYPTGGGELRLVVQPGELRPLDWAERGRVTEVRAIALSCGLPDHVTERGIKALRRGLAGVGRPVKVESRTVPGPQPGAAVLISGKCQRGRFGFVGLGEKRKPMERVVEEACHDFWAWHKSEAATDEHLADQLVLPLALTEGESRWTTNVVSEHLRTVLWVVARFLPVHYAIEGRSVTLRGAGGL
jgi:RNA 3'-terminal phosphate cyclase (ATP)